MSPHVRLFDHEEAVRRVQAGESQAALAREYGVTGGAIFRAVKRTDPEWCERQNKYHREYQRGYKKRLSCRECGTAIWARGRNEKPTGLCRTCLGLSRARGVRPDELLCHVCEEWKPDEEFPLSRGKKARRDRHSCCRCCQAAVRQAYRERHKQPCVHCGAPALPPNEKTTHGALVPRCRPCFYAECAGRLAERLAQLGVNVNA